MSTDNLRSGDNFCDRLRKARKLKGFGQVQLAEKLGVSSGAVGNWESKPGKPPTAENIGRLASVLEVSTKWLLYGEEEKVLSLHEESIMTGDIPTAQKCREHLNAFLDTCQTPAQLGWTYCELQDRFPLTKFKPKDES